MIAPQGQAFPGQVLHVGNTALKAPCAPWVGVRLAVRLGGVNEHEGPQIALTLIIRICCKYLTLGSWEAGLHR